MMLKTEWKEQGFIDEPVAEGIDLKTEIRRLCKEKDAIILAHYYTIGDIQDIADFVGDSLALEPVSCCLQKRQYFVQTSMLAVRWQTLARQKT